MVEYERSGWFFFGVIRGSVMLGKEGRWLLEEELLLGGKEGKCPWDGKMPLARREGRKEEKEGLSMRSCETRSFHSDPTQLQLQRPEHPRCLALYGTMRKRISEENDSVASLYRQPEIAMLKIEFFRYGKALVHTGHRSVQDTVSDSKGTFIGVFRPTGYLVGGLIRSVILLNVEECAYTGRCK